MVLRISYVIHPHKPENIGFSSDDNVILFCYSLFVAYCVFSDETSTIPGPNMREPIKPDVIPDSETCLIRHSNKTIITNLYGGIPETLILNIIAWTIFILLFSVLRQQAWDYGRLALVNSSGLKKRWTQLFYAHGTDAESAAASPRNSIEVPASPTATSTAGSTTTTNAADRAGFFAWIFATLKLTREQILMHSGPDAVHYLSFQQHLMTVMAIIKVISIAVILPVNYSGSLTGDVNSLGHTTISNLSPESPLLWIHVLIAIGYVPLVVLIMRRASGRNAFKTASTRTIMVTHISQADCNKPLIRNYVKELFPDINIEDIQLAYSIARLTEVVEAYEKTVEARIYCELHRDPYPVQASPRVCSCSATVDGIEYYRAREEQLSGEVARLRAAALNDPLGIAFITVSTPVEARNVIQHFKPGTYREWHMSFAPSPSDIFWEHLSVSSSHWYVKWTCVNAVLFLFLFFLTTPVYIVNLLNTFSVTKDVQKFTPLISEFLPTLMLWLLAALMPVAVSFSDKWLSHWTRSRQNYSIMTKSFGYLLLMILVLPSLGLTSAQALIEWTIRNNTDSFSFRWQCIFLPDKGAFFVNYVITAAFIGTALELLRFADLILYIWRLCTAQSRAETPHIRKAILIEFPFGIHYAWTILLFTMCTVYSVICPLIMPFAMVYITLKHFGDRHNLYYAYGPSNMISQGGGRIHSTAVTMTKFSVILLLMVMAALASVRTANIGVDARAVVLMLALFGSLIVFAFMSPIKRCTTKRPSMQEPEAASPVYIAKVLLLKRRLGPSEVAAANAAAAASAQAAAASLTPAHHGASRLEYGTDGAPMVEVVNEQRRGNERRSADDDEDGELTRRVLT